MPGATGPGHNVSEHHPASWDKALQSEFTHSQFASTSVTHPNGLGYFWEETEPEKSRQENNRGRKGAEEENHGQER